MFTLNAYTSTLYRKIFATMSYNQQNVPVNANFNQNVLNAFNELNIKEEILIKNETNVTEVEEIFDLADEHLVFINNHDSAVLYIMVKLQEAADAMGQPNGISLTNARAMVRESKDFVKNMKQIFKRCKTYEDATQIVPDYDLQDEAKICSLGWYARMVRQTLAQTAHISTAIRLYHGSRCAYISKLADQLTFSGNLSSALRAHARARYPLYYNYIIH